MISGGHLEAEINGSLGTPENRMNTDVDSIKAKADDIYLNNISDKMEIRGMTAENIDIIARGDIFGKDVRSGNLVIRSNGHTGYSDNPLLIHVSGNVDIGSAYGEVHYVNSYRLKSQLKKNRDRSKIMILKKSLKESLLHRMRKNRDSQSLSTGLQEFPKL